MPGVRPATLRLMWRAEDSYDLYRGSRKLGTARVEETGKWTARFDREGRAWLATAEDAPDLLRLTGAFILAHEAREAPAVEGSPPAEKSVPAAERRLSENWKRLQEKRRLSRLDDLLRQARKRIVPLKT